MAREPFVLLLCHVSISYTNFITDIAHKFVKSFFYLNILIVLDSLTQMLNEQRMQCVQTVSKFFMEHVIE